VAVREDDRGDHLRVEARALDVADQRPGAAAGAGIDHDELAIEIDDEAVHPPTWKMFGRPQARRIDDFLSLAHATSGIRVTVDKLIRKKIPFAALIRLAGRTVRNEPDMVAHA